MGDSRRNCYPIRLSNNAAYAVRLPDHNICIFFSEVNIILLLDSRSARVVNVKSPYETQGMLEVPAIMDAEWNRMSYVIHITYEGYSVRQGKRRIGADFLPLLETKMDYYYRLLSLIWA